MNILELKSKLSRNEFKCNLEKLYGFDEYILNYQSARYNTLLEEYSKVFDKNDDVYLFSAPGRTEICGNHTDHQHGAVIAAAVNLDMIACCSLNSSSKVRIYSHGFDFDEIDISDLNINPTEINTSKSLVRGIASKITSMGYKLSGFNAYIMSDVLTGSGLSSSAAFEVLIGIIFNSLFCNGKVSDIEIAKIGQYAENEYFKKPCGLMDQMASSVGGMVFIDFKIPESPYVEKIKFNFSNENYALCIIDTGADHADLTDEYASIPREMGLIANFFDKKVLRDVDETQLYLNINNLRSNFGDRALLRSIHFFEENDRVFNLKQMLIENNFTNSLNIIKDSGHSSFEYLQNVYVSSDSKNQSVSLALAICQKFLKQNGAFRVHGGGFAGTIQAFVPLNILPSFKDHVESALGKNRCHILSIRDYGGVSFFNL